MSLSTRRGLLLAVLLVFGACGSPKQSTPEGMQASPACICGTPSAAMNGCPHTLCISGKTNPENPECVCGTLQFGASKN